MYEERWNRRFNIAVAFSFVLHVVMVLLTSRSAPPPGEVLSMQEVSFMDVTYRPEVARILSKDQMGGGGASAASENVPTYSSGVASDDVPAIDLSSTLDRDPSQAKIDLDRYELDRGSDGMGVIRLGGSGSEKSTDEILAQPKVQLARGLGRGTGAEIGLRGVPGVPQQQAQLTIEHRQLSKPTAQALPTMSTQDLPKVEAAVSKGTNFMVAGPISQRQVTRKLVPRYPKWALDRHVSGTVVVRLWVNPAGQVKGAPTVESSSGYPDLDQVVVDALRAWEFAPLAAGTKTEDQWGLITFRFTLS